MSIYFWLILLLIVIIIIIIIIFYQSLVIESFDNPKIQEYIDWLTSMGYQFNGWSKQHLMNYCKLLNGQQLTRNDLLTASQYPTTAEQYFNQLYDANQILKLPAPLVSETAGAQLPANYDQYSQYVPPQKLKHLIPETISSINQIVKNLNQDVIYTIRPQIEHVWDRANGDAVDAATKEINRQYVKQLTERSYAGVGAETNII